MGTYLQRDTGAPTVCSACVFLPDDRDNSVISGGSGAFDSPDKTSLHLLKNASTGAVSGELFHKVQEALTLAETRAGELTAYTAVLEMQEAENGELPPAKTVYIKIRRAPFSVYMRWHESNQEAIFVDGENDNRLLVKPPKGLAALKRVWRLDPESRMAKQSSRYPITDSGLENLAARIRAFYKTRNDWLTVTRCVPCNAVVAGQELIAYDVHFQDEQVSPAYSRSRYCFDEQGLLVALENYGWSERDGKKDLLEKYVYHTIDSDVSLDDQDFDEKNPEYTFVAR